MIKNCLRIGLTGGEPFLNKDIFKIMDLIKKSGYILSVVSNGTLINSMIDQVKKSGIDVLGLSLYNENIISVANTVPKLRDSMFIKIHRVVFANELHNIEPAIGLSLKMGAHGIIFNNYFTTDKDKKHRVIYDDNEEFYEIKREIDEKFAKRIAIQWCSTFPREVTKRKCRLVFHHIELDAQGNISSCCFAYPDGEKYGNILKDNNVWNNEFFIKLRQSLINSDLPIHPICKDCPYLYENLYGI